VAVVEQFGGEVGRDPIVLRKELELLGSNVKEETEEQLYQGSKIGKDNYLAMALIRASDPSRYGRLMDYLSIPERIQHLSGERYGSISLANALRSESTDYGVDRE
jgi:hypothetical protein